MLLFIWNKTGKIWHYLNSHEAKVISQFLPESLDDEEIEKVVVMVIEKIGAKGMKDMGKVMGLVTKEIAGRADGKTISTIVRHNLNQ